MDTLTIEALSASAAIRAILDLAHDTRAHIVLTEHGVPWAELNISPMTDTRVSLFPTFSRSTAIGDTRKRGQAGVHYLHDVASSRETVSIAVNRARKMHRL